MFDQQPPSGGEDRELTQAAARGDRAAFGALVRQHQAALMRFARVLTRDEAAAEDVFQETFLAAFRAIATYRGDASFRTWLFTIARHRAGRLARKRAGEPPVLTPLQELGEAAGWGAEEGTPSLGDQVAARELLGQALGALSEEERAVIILRDLEGFSGEEAAEVLGLTLPALKSRLHRARLRLAAFARQGGDDGTRP